MRSPVDEARIVAFERHVGGSGPSIVASSLHDWLAALRALEAVDVHVLRK
jgi:hypothetical protein